MIDQAWSRHLVAAALGFLLPNATMADVITVDDDDPFADFATIQEAVDVAIDGDLIEVGPGYYFSTAPDGVPLVEVIGKSIAIMATSADPAETVLAGQGVRQCVVWQNAPGECRLDGFTVDSGYAEFDGGGASIDGAAVEISDCVFQFCTAARNGGAIRFRSDTVLPPVVRDCRFLSNSAGIHGGAITAVGGLDVYGARFQENVSTVYGGGVHFDGDPAGKANFSIVQDCSFLDCESEYGGGIYGFRANLILQETSLIGCIAGNEAALTGWGGGVGVFSGSLRMTGGSISSCEGGESSGAVDLERSVGFLADVTISGNTAWSFAGAVYGNGKGTAIRFEDCDFTGNAAQAGTGGAIVCDSGVGSLELERCTFDDNFAFGTLCLSAPNIVTARDCDFDAQSPDAFGFVGTPKVRLGGIGTGSRFIGCRFVDGRSIDDASAFQAQNIGGLEFIDCEFIGNETTADGVDVEGAVSISAFPDNDDPIRFRNCVFRNNQSCCVGPGFFAATGGAVRVSGRAAEASFCVFESNQGIEGGSLYGEFHLSNCRIAGLSSLGYGGAAYLLEGSSVVDCWISGSADCNYPWIYATGPVSIRGCTMSGAFPEGFECFPDPAELAGCRLLAGTTVQDTRFCHYDPAAIFGDWTDLGGNSFHAGECDFADINGDGEVNGADLALVLASWGEPCLGCAADVDQDGEVDGADLALVLAGWGP